MSVLYILLAIVILLLIINLFVSLKSSNSDVTRQMVTIQSSLAGISDQLKANAANAQQEMYINRTEAAQNSRDQRTEMGTQLSAFGQSMSESVRQISELQAEQLRNFSQQLTHLTSTLNENLSAFQLNLQQANKESRTEQRQNNELLKSDLNNALSNFKDKLRENFSDFDKQQQQQSLTSSEKLDAVRNTLESSIKSLQDGNEKRLEEMRNTVDEKLQKTLETRLTQSFELVSKNLESVQKGLGEMQQLAVGVGDLKKVLTNVKTRGIMGEVQLSNILQQMLAPEQYEVNCITRPGSTNRVEFAIKIPQHQQNNKLLLMPIDSKFPIEAFYNLQAAYDAGDHAAADAAGRALEAAIKKAAKDIHEKYICPPDTSELGLLFLPIEGLYAEAVRRPALIETLQRDFQVIVTGPTTLSAILNTVSFGYKTMAMEQRSGEIKQTLSAVKTEFGKFGDVLKKAQEKIVKASEDIDELVGVRTKKINARLKSFEELPATDAQILLGDAPEP